jgi:hypothetical protein
LMLGDMGASIHEKHLQKRVCIPPSLWLRSAASELGVRLAKIGDRHGHLAAILRHHRGPCQEAMPSAKDQHLLILIHIAGTK